MTTKYDEIKFKVLRRILSIDGPLSYADLGYLCGPATIRTMAVNGLIDVKITIKPKGKEVFDGMCHVRLKRERKRQIAKQAALVCDLHVPMCDFAKDDSDGVDGLHPNKQEAA